jgi:hypothetical protein
MARRLRAAAVVSKQSDLQKKKKFEKNPRKPVL